jgi:hypothetical protein
VVVQPPSRVFRVGKTPDAWLRKPPSRGSDPTLNRYDDPLGIYHTVYASSTAYGAYMETLAPLRPSRTDFAAAVTVDEPSLRGTPPAGLVTNWVERRHIGKAHLNGLYADIGATESIAYLRHRLEDRFAALGVVEFDLIALTSARREVAMEISRFVFELEYREQRRFDGICYPSRLGRNITCWAIFEDDQPACITQKQSQPVNSADPEFLEALNELRISVGPISAAS